ncbi:MAG: EAL domain-containing protein [Methylocystis sp.]
MSVFYNSAHRSTSTKLSSLRSFFMWQASKCLQLLDGDLLAFEERTPSSVVVGRIRTEQLTSLASNTVLMMLASALNALVWMSVTFPTPKAGLGLAWGAIVLCLCGFVAFKRLNDDRSNFSAPSKRGLHLATCYAFAFGVIWGLLPIMFFGDAAPGERLIIVCLSSGMMFGGATALWTIPTALLAFLAPIFCGSLYTIDATEGPAFGALAALLVVYTLFLFGASLVRSVAMARRCVAMVDAENSVLKDELTKLPNRAIFRNELTRALARQDRNGGGFAVMCFDLDGFKKVNDTMGHAAGDQVLIEAARRLSQSTRSVDTLARFGGDEFALIATDIFSPSQAKVVADRIVRAFKEPFVVDGAAHKVTISVGVALAPTDGVDGSALLRNADSALYATKNSGRSGFTLFREQFRFVAERTTLEAELDRALAQRELDIVYQPFVHVESLRTTGFEALVRWRHPSRGVLEASDIIPLLERAGLIDAVGAHILKEAVAAAASWPERLRLAVPVSHLQLLKPGFAQTVKAILEDADFNPRRLELELSQSALIVESPEAIEQLRMLRDMGVKTALKDLDAGYGSLVGLVELPLNRLKIDKRFVRDLVNKSMCASIVRISSELARALNLEVTAEGVENSAQLAAIRGLGCMEAQGPAFGAPRGSADLEALYEFSRLATKSRRRRLERVA